VPPWYVHQRLCHWGEGGGKLQYCITWNFCSQTLMFTRWGWHCIGGWFCVCVCVCGHARVCMPCNNTQYSWSQLVVFQMYGVLWSQFSYEGCDVLKPYFVCLCMYSCGAVILTSSYQVVTWYICLLTAVGFPPSGNSTVHINTQTIHRTTQNKQYIEQHKNLGRVRATPCLCGLYPGICLTTEEKARKTSVRVAEECQLVQWILRKCCVFSVRVW
jgi:hypothetical protein